MKIILLSPTYNEANCYIAYDNRDGVFNECAVIDPGANAERIFKTAENNGLKIGKIILTHAHFDHIMAVNELAALCSAPVIVHKADFQALFEPSLNFSILGTGKSYSVEKGITVTTVSDSDIIRVGNSAFSVISTPGHTPGSCCFECDDIIITGDTLFAGNIGRTDFPGGNICEMKKSLARLSDLPKNYTLYPGHGEKTTLEAERRFNYYLRTDFENEF